MHQSVLRTGSLHTCILRLGSEPFFRYFQGFKPRLDRGQAGAEAGASGAAGEAEEAAWSAAAELGE